MSSRYPETQEDFLEEATLTTFPLLPKSQTCSSQENLSRIRGHSPVLISSLGALGGGRARPCPKTLLQRNSCRCRVGKALYAHSPLVALVLVSKGAENHSVPG